jgi:hypothetical protein
MIDNEWYNSMPSIPTFSALIAATQADPVLMPMELARLKPFGHGRDVWRSENESDIDELTGGKTWKNKAMQLAVTAFDL